MKHKSEPIRPLWLVISTLIIGMLIVSGILALVDHYLGALSLLFPILIGLTGGLFGWLLADRMHQHQRLTLYISGALFTLGVYFIYHYFAYILFIANVEPMSLSAYITMYLEQGTTFSRRSYALFTLTGTALLIYWLIELSIALLIGATIAYQADKHSSQNA